MNAPTPLNAPTSLTADQASELVATAEQIYARRDLDQILGLFTDDAVINWNGRQVAHGTDEIRAWHQRALIDAMTDFTPTKKLRAVSENTIAAQWDARFTDRKGQAWTQHAAEVWTMRGHLLAVWDAWAINRPVDPTPTAPRTART